MRSTKPSAYGFIAGAYVFLFAMIALSWGCAAPRPGLPRTKAERDASAVTVRVVCVKNGDIIVGDGSGVLIGHNRLLTAYHVVDCPKIIAIVVNHKTAPQTVEVDRTWPKHDIARLHFVDEQVTTPQPKLGYVRRRNNICTAVVVPTRETVCGQVTMTYSPSCPKNEWCHDFTFTGDVVPGNSGGAVYNQYGELVGLVTGGAFLPNIGLPLGVGYGSSLAPIIDEIFEDK